MIIDTLCVGCGESIRATEDDEVPRCGACQGEWAEVQVVHSIMRGEMNHLIPELQEEDDG